MLVFPEHNGTFRQGRDVVDAFPDFEGRQWIYPAKYIPEVTIGIPGVCLVVDPRQFEVTKTRVIVHPESVTIDNLLAWVPDRQQVANIKIDSIVCNELIKRLNAEQRRWLFRIGGPGVKPLVRSPFEFVKGWTTRNSCNWKDHSLGIALEVNEMVPWIDQTELSYGTFGL